MECNTEQVDNTSLQADEIEALMSIYQDDWRVEDEEKRIYSITLHCEGSKEELYFQVTLPPDYPSHAPPVYEIRAPWMKPGSKEALTNALEDYWCTHLGESILYDWVEVIQDSLAQQEQRTSVSEEQPPVALEQLTLNDASPEKVHKDEVEIFHGETLVDRRSVFQAHLAAVTSPRQVEYVLAILKENKKIAEATHNIWAYRIISDHNPSIVSKDSEDDGEVHAGNRLLHLLDIIDAKNVCVVVTRWYGGTHLGPDRFKHINNCARKLLVEHGYIRQDKDESAAETKTKEKRRSTPKKKC